MKEDPWLKTLAQFRAAMPECNWPPDDEIRSYGSSPFDETTLSFVEQIVRGIWPVRMPVVIEIYAEGHEPHFEVLHRGEKRRNATSQLVTLYLEYDRAKVREMTLDQIHSRQTPRSSKLAHMVTLVRVDRGCFLETAAAHFVETLARSDEALRRDPWLVEVLRELLDYDPDLVGDVVAETMRLDRAAGQRLADVILDVVDRPGVRDHFGWLAAATMTQQLQDLLDS